jgi:hypothetical protein
VALALRTSGESEPVLTSNWCLVPKEVNPGDAVEMEAVFTIPEGTEQRDWEYDMVCVGSYWFSRHNRLSGRVAFTVEEPR